MELKLRIIASFTFELKLLIAPLMELKCDLFL